MKGLLYEDLVHLRRFLLVGPFSIVFFLASVQIFLNRLGEKDPAYSFVTSAPAYQPILITAYFVFQRDEGNKWNVYILSSPVDKRLLMRSQYLLLSCILPTSNLMSLPPPGSSHGSTQEVSLEHYGVIDLTLPSLSVFLPTVY